MLGYKIYNYYGNYGGANFLNFRPIPISVTTVSSNMNNVKGREIGSNTKDAMSRIGDFVSSQNGEDGWDDWDQEDNIELLKRTDDRNGFSVNKSDVSTLKNSNYFDNYNRFPSEKNNTSHLNSNTLVDGSEGKLPLSGGHIKLRRGSNGTSKEGKLSLAAMKKAAADKQKKHKDGIKKDESRAKSNTTAITEPGRTSNVEDTEDDIFANFGMEPQKQSLFEEGKPDKRINTVKMIDNVEDNGWGDDDDLDI